MLTHINSGVRASRTVDIEHGHFLDQFTRDINRNNLFFQFEPQHQIISESPTISTDEFSKRIKRCLLLLKKKAPEYYGLFCLFNVKVRANDEYRTCANYKNNTIDLHCSIQKESDEWIAAVLIHETIHFWQIRAGSPHFGTSQKNWQDENRQALELEAIGYQLDVLRKIGGSDEDVKFLERQRGTHDGFVRYTP